MRRGSTRAAAVAMALASGAGCGKGPVGAPPAEVEQVVRQDRAIRASETDLLTQRGALQRQRRRLSEERTALAERRRALPAADAAAHAALEQEEHELGAREAEALDKELQLTSRLDQMVRDRAQLVDRLASVAARSAGGDPALGVAHREEGVAGREKDLARREAELAARERELAAREGAVGRREREGCAPATTTTVIRTELPEGLRYGRKEVEPIYRKALKLMADKGLLAGDLPGGGARLVDQAREHMEKGEYVKARYAADQLFDTIQGTQVDRGFLAGKIQRLSAAMRGRTLAPAQRKEIDLLFRDATTLYGDGKFGPANQRINKIFALLP